MISSVSLSLPVISGSQMANSSPQIYHIEQVPGPIIQFIFITFTEITESSVLRLQLVNYTYVIVNKIKYWPSMCHSTV